MSVTPYRSTPGGETAQCAPANGRCEPPAVPVVPHYHERQMPGGPRVTSRDGGMLATTIVPGVLVLAACLGLLVLLFVLVVGPARARPAFQPAPAMTCRCPP